MAVNGPKLLLVYADDIDLVENTVSTIMEIFGKIDKEMK